MALVVLSFLYLQNQFFGSDLSSDPIVPKSEYLALSPYRFVQLLISRKLFLVNAVAGIFQIILFTIFLYIEEGSLAALKLNVSSHILSDVKTTFKMSLPPIFLLLSNELLLLSSKILPIQSASAGSYTIVGVAVFSILMFKRRFFLSQALAVYFVAKGLDHFPIDNNFDVSQAATDSTTVFYGHLAIVWAILFYGISYVTLEKILKSSDVSLWIRGIQLNLFTVPFSLMMWYANKYVNDDPRGFFDNFTIIGWFYIIFKVAQQMMELFVIKIADSIYRCLALATALVVIGIMRHPFDIEANFDYVPVKLGAGLVLSGVCLYAVMDQFPKWGEINDTDSDDEYRDSPVDANETLSKGYQTVQTVSSSVSNADVYLKLIDDPLRDS
jgi:Nucleotide-sugar transporter